MASDDERRAANRAVLRRAIAAIGTVAMLWVGGNILTHGVAELGFPWLYETIHHLG